MSVKLKAKDLADLADRIVTDYDGGKELLQIPQLWSTTVFKHTHPMPDFHFWLWDFLTDNSIRRLAIALPRGHSKTTVINKEYPLWRLAQDPSYRIAIVQKSLSQAQNILMSTQRILASNKTFRRYHGDWKPTQDGYPWNTSMMRLAQNTTDAETHNLMAFGTGSKDILGGRYNELLLDDLIYQDKTGSNADTPEKRAAMDEWLFSVVDMTLLGSETDLLRLSGTAWYYDDVLMGKEAMATCVIGPGDWPHPNELTTAEKSGWVFIRKDAEVGMKEGCTLWMNQANWERLEHIKLTHKEGSSGYRRGMRNQVQNPGKAIFKEVWLTGGTDEDGVECPGCLDHDRDLGEYPQGVDGLRTINGADPSTGRDSPASSKFAHLSIAAVPGAHERYMIDMFTAAVPQQDANDYLGRSEDKQTQVGTIIYRHHRYGAFTTVIEDVSWTRAWVDAVRQCDPRLHITPMVTGQNKNSNEVGIESMRGIFQNGLVRIPYKSPSTKSVVNVFIEQLWRYGDTSFSDLVMAFWFCNFNISKSFKPRVLHLNLNKLGRRAKKTPIRDWSQRNAMGG